MAALAREGDVELDLVTRRSDGDRWRALAPGAGILSPAPDGRLAGTVAWGALSLGAALRRGLPEAAVFFGPHYSMPARLRVPAAVTVHDLSMIDHPEWHERSKVVFFGRALRRCARRGGGDLRERDDGPALPGPLRATGAVHVVPHGIDHAVFRPDEGTPGADAAVLAGLGVAGPYVLHLGHDRAAEERAGPGGGLRRRGG